MKKYEQYKKLMMFFMSFLMVAVMATMYGYVWYKHYLYLVVYPFLGKGNLLLIVVYAILLAFFLQVYSGYKFGYLKTGDIIFSQVLSIFITNVITYFQISLIGRSLFIVKPMFWLTVAEFIFVSVWSFVAAKLYHKMYPPHNTLMIYGSKMADSLEKKMLQRSDKYQIQEIIDVNVGLEKLQEKMDEYDAILICDVKTEMRNKILKYCFENSIRTYITPKISDIIIRSADSIHLFDTPLLLCRNNGLTFEQKFMKRLVDIVISFIILVITSPFMLITAIAIKVYDGGPVIFKQERVTLNGRKFYVYKFRSMIINAEKDGVAVLAAKNDSRITPVGKFIRATRLDELPQLYNILKGDMSLVGPRPERPQILSDYEKTIPEFAYRLKVKGGLTGYAQVMGKYNTTAYDKLKLDLMYIENYSLALDIKLLLMTIKTVFMKESTEGIETQKEQKSE